MGMYEEMITDLENTVIDLLKHLRRCVALLSQYAEMDEEEKYLEGMEKKIVGVSGDEPDDPWDSVAK